MNTKTIKGPKDAEGNTLEIELDKGQVFPNDPGQGTPAMVLKKDKNGREVDSGTYWCAVESGELSHNGTWLTNEQVEWLNTQTLTVDGFLYNT
jgi:hypothetical protein